MKEPDKKRENLINKLNAKLSKKIHNRNLQKLLVENPDIARHKEKPNYKKIPTSFSNGKLFDSRDRNIHPVRKK